MNFSDAYVNVKGPITVPNTATVATPSNNNDKKLIFKLCAPFADYTRKIKNKKKMLNTLI